MNFCLVSICKTRRSIKGVILAFQLKIVALPEQILSLKRVALGVLGKMSLYSDPWFVSCSPLLELLERERRPS
jgi:hypothetical protein